MHFILASRSPRREQLLKELGLKFDLVVPDNKEEYPAHLSGAAIAEYLAKEKALQFKGKISSHDIVITADTIVWCINRVLDKPSDYKEAVEILRFLSGKTHDVITGVTFFSNFGDHTFSETTRVTFDHLTDEEINFYVKEFEPYDKAGAYGIQEWIGLAGITRIEGSFFNVMGLPVQKLYTELKKYINSLDNL
ncbi:MAG: septum formation protein Maf [Odoribacter sp.]|nr:septum formation protein Maf [Odoribacter sp.]